MEKDPQQEIKEELGPKTDAQIRRADGGGGEPPLPPVQGQEASARPSEPENEREEAEKGQQEQQGPNWEEDLNNNVGEAALQAMDEAEQALAEAEKETEKHQVTNQSLGMGMANEQELETHQPTDQEMGLAASDKEQGTGPSNQTESRSGSQGQQSDQEMEMGE